MSKPNQRNSHLFMRIIVTFCCFIIALMALWYWGMGGDFSSVQNFIMSRGGLTNTNAKPPALFYQTIGVGTGLDDSSSPTKTVNNMFTLELQVVATRSQADRMISDLLKRGVRAFYTEHSDKNGKKIFSIRRGLYSTLEEAQSASRILLAQRSLRNRVVELSP